MPWRRGNSMLCPLALLPTSCIGYLVFLASSTMRWLGLWSKGWALSWKSSTPCLLVMSSIILLCSSALTSVSRVSILVSLALGSRFHYMRVYWGLRLPWLEQMAFLSLCSKNPMSISLQPCEFAYSSLFVSLF